MGPVFIFCATLLIITSNCCLETKANDSLKSEKDIAQKARLPPCRACKIFVESFKKGLDRTSKYKFEGGDTAWEEEKLGSYATSEVRFVEIHESLCSEVVEGKNQCYTLLEEYDEALETWWFKKQKDEPDLLRHLCIDTFEVCCPDLHYGKNCTPCPGYPDNVCHNNGKCKGSGTRKGDGKCHCEQAYTSEYCDSCSDNFFQSYRDDKKVLCSPCHVSCEGNCTKAGPTGCEKCKNGWMEHNDRGCTDINECITGKSPCTPLQFCVNSEGSFRCIDCHPSCLGCTGDGPDECINCASGFKKNDKICININEEERQQYAFLSRYLTYLGLCICTCIVLNRSTYVAAIVGLCVGIYITVSEYILNSSPAPTNDLGQQLAEQLTNALN